MTDYELCPECGDRMDFCTGCPISEDHLNGLADETESQLLAKMRKELERLNLKAEEIETIQRRFKGRK